MSRRKPRPRLGVKAQDLAASLIAENSTHFLEQERIDIANDEEPDAISSRQAPVHRWQVLLRRWAAIYSVRAGLEYESWEILAAAYLVAQHYADQVADESGP